MTDLPAGRMTTRLKPGGTDLLRPIGSWTSTVHEYLRHLEYAGFRGDQPGARTRAVTMGS
jgi:hypothetical protein